MGEEMDRLGKAKSLFSQGVGSYEQKRFSEAIDKWKASKTVLENLGRSPEILGEIARTDEYIARAWSALDRIEEALISYANARKNYEKIEMWLQYADVDMNEGQLLFEIGDYEKADSHYRRAYERYIWIKNRINHFRVPGELKMGERLYELFRGRWIPKEEITNGYQMIFRKIAEAQHAIGTTLNAKKIYDEALKTGESTRSLCQSLGIWEGVAASETTIGIATRGLHRPEDALEHYKKARSLYRKLDLHRDVARAEANIGQTLFALGKPLEARKRYKSALKIFDELDLIFDEAKVYYSMALTQLVQDPSHNLKQVLHDLDSSYGLFERVLMGVRAPRFRRSLRETYINVSESQCAVHLLMYKQTYDEQHLKNALNCIELAKCSTVAESLEMGSEGVPCPKVTDLVSQEEEFLKKIEHYTANEQNLREKQKLKEITQSEFSSNIEDMKRNLNELYKKIEDLRFEVSMNCTDQGSVPLSRKYEVLRRALEVLPVNEKWCILEFAIFIVAQEKRAEDASWLDIDESISRIPLTNKLVVFLVDQTGHVQHTVHDVGLEDVWKLAERCRSIFRKLRIPTNRRKINKELEELSTDLYEALIPKDIGEKLKKYLETQDSENKHLIVIPDKFLNWVPFELLNDGDDYWGLQYAISTSFSLDLARICVEKRVKRAVKMRESPIFFMVKNPLFDLTFANEEVNSVIELLRNKRIRFKVLHNEEATRRTFIKTANSHPFNILHYAGHAKFMGKDPSLSHLNLHTDGECPACSLKPEEHKADFLTANEVIHGIKFKRTPIVYLSGCESGITEVMPGDEMFGLVRALIYAGATSVILSRWSVGDSVAPVFAKEFYRQLLSKESAAVSLQNARRKVFDLGPLNFTDWGVFSLQGDPFRRLW